MTRHLQPVPTMNSLRRTRTRQKHTSSLGSYSAYAGERFSDEDEDDDDADEGDGDSGWSSTSLDTKDHTASLFSLVTSLDKSSTDTVTPLGPTTITKPNYREGEEEAKFHYPDFEEEGDDSEEKVDIQTTLPKDQAVLAEIMEALQPVLPHCKFHLHTYTLRDYESLPSSAISNRSVAAKGSMTQMKSSSSLDAIHSDLRPQRSKERAEMHPSLPPYESSMNLIFPKIALSGLRITSFKPLPIIDNAQLDINEWSDPAPFKNPPFSRQFRQPTFPEPKPKQILYGEEEDSEEEEERINLEREYPPHLPSRPSSGINVTTQCEGLASNEQSLDVGRRSLSNGISGNNDLASTKNGIRNGQSEDGWDTFKPIRRKSPASASNLVPFSAMPLLDRPKHTRDERTYNKHYPLQSSDHPEQCDKCGSVLNNYTRSLFNRNNNKTKNDIRQILSIPSPPISPELQTNPLPGLSYEQRYANAWESDEEVEESDSERDEDEDEDGAMDDAIEDASEKASDSARLFGGNDEFLQINNNKRDHLDYRGSNEIKAQDEFGSSRGKTSSLSSAWEDDSLIAPVLGHGITISLPPARMNKFQNIANTPHDHDKGAPVHDQMEKEDKQQVTLSQSISAFDHREMPITVVGWDDVDDEEKRGEADSNQKVKLADQWDPEIAFKKIPSPSYPVSSKSGSPTNSAAHPERQLAPSLEQYRERYHPSPFPIKSIDSIEVEPAITGNTLKNEGKAVTNDSKHNGISRLIREPLIPTPASQGFTRWSKIKEEQEEISPFVHESRSDTSTLQSEDREGTTHTTEVNPGLNVWKVKQAGHAWSKHTEMQSLLT